MTYLPPLPPDPLKGSSGDLFTELNRLSMPFTIPKGTTLFEQGDAVSDVFVIRTGTISLYWQAGDRPVLLDNIRVGHIVGLPAVFNGEYSMKAVVFDDAEVCRIPAAWVREMLDFDVKLALSALKLVSRELRRLRIRIPAISSEAAS